MFQFVLKKNEYKIITQKPETLLNCYWLFGENCVCELEKMLRSHTQYIYIIHIYINNTVIAIDWWVVLSFNFEVVKSVEPDVWLWSMAITDSASVEVMSLFVSLLTTSDTPIVPLPRVSTTDLLVVTSGLINQALDCPSLTWQLNGTGKQPVGVFPTVLFQPHPRQSHPLRPVFLWSKCWRIVMKGSGWTPGVYKYI